MIRSGSDIPKQELFSRQEISDRRIEVLKTYDQGYAREAFDNMDVEAQSFLWNTLRPEQTPDLAGLPTPEEPLEREAFLWDELVDQARDWQTFS